MKKMLLGFLFLSSQVIAQNVYTVAGNGLGACTGDSLPATVASIYEPSGVAVDGAGNIYIADNVYNVVRMVNTSGVITTIAGVAGMAGFSGDGGNADIAELDGPDAVAVDPYGNLYIADKNNVRIRRVTGGIITTAVGGGGSLAEGSSDTAYSLVGPTGIAFDATGNMYIADGNRVHECSAGQTITTIAGGDDAGFSGDGSPAVSAMLNNPAGIAVVGSDIYIADVSNNRIRMINASGIITTIAGNGSLTYSGDNVQAVRAALNNPVGVAAGPGGIYIADQGNNRIRMVDGGGIIRKIAGNGTSGFVGDGGAASSCELSYPGSITFDANGNLFIADVLNNRIREVKDLKPLGINNTTPDPQMAIYPNPAADEVTISGLSQGDRVVIYDLAGAAVYTGTASGSELHADISGLSSAVYFVSVVDETGVVMSRGRVAKL